MKYRKILVLTTKAALCAVFLTFGNGCSFLSGKPEPKTHGKRVRPSITKENAKKRIENTPAEVSVERPTPKPNRVEVVWAAEGEADYFLVRYGPKADQLDKEALIEAHALETIEDPERAQKLYRYIINDAPANLPLHVTVSSVKGDKVSAPSAAAEVSPAEEQ